MRVDDFMQPVNEPHSNIRHNVDVHYITRKEYVFSPGMYASSQEITYRKMLCVSPGDPVEKALEIMLQEKIQSLPVTRNGRVIGLVSARDLLIPYFSAENKETAFSNGNQP